jgi:hypothetical protein
MWQIILSAGPGILFGLWLLSRCCQSDPEVRIGYACVAVSTVSTVALIVALKRKDRKYETTRIHSD